MKAQFYLSDVKAYERAHGLGPAAQVPSAPPSPLDREEAAPDREEGAKTPKEDAELMLAQGLDAGAVMLKIKDKWKITKYVAAAMALREEIPTDDEGKERMKKRWQYHTKQ